MKNGPRLVEHGNYNRTRQRISVARRKTVCLEETPLRSEFASNCVRFARTARASSPTCHGEKVFGAMAPAKAPRGLASCGHAPVIDPALGLSPRRPRRPPPTLSHDSRTSSAEVFCFAKCPVKRARRDGGKTARRRVGIPLRFRRKRTGKKRPADENAGRRDEASRA